MISKAQKYCPPSLARCFELQTGEDDSEQNYRGEFAWVCGYSADAHFLNDALERFTGYSQGRRAYDGRCYLALMLDPSQPQILPADCPGALHLPVKTQELPFHLLHAKLAVLGFGNTKEPEKWCIRLIVSTGNWTRETLESSLDMAYVVDVFSDDIASNNVEKLNCAADIAAAWGLIEWLKDSFFDSRIIAPQQGSRIEERTLKPIAEISKWIQTVSSFGKDGIRSFVDNRETPFLKSVPKLVAERKPGGRNSLSFGSGFFESTENKSEVPSVLQKIVEELRANKLITANSNIDVFVNPQACQSVASTVSAIQEEGWAVREALVPEFFRGAKRGLHAKFVFGTQYRDNSQFCNNSWLYFGSGNLTHPGFCQMISRNGGNLEAGVVLFPDELYWQTSRTTPPEKFVRNLLPVQWDTDFEEREAELSFGSEMPEKKIEFFAAPVPFFFATKEQEQLWLIHSEITSVPFEVLDSAGNACTFHPEKGFLWPESSVRQVRIRWQNEGSVFVVTVPVIDEFGRLAASELRQLSADEVWWQLANFPQPSEDEELDMDDVDDFGSEPKSHSGRAKGVEAKYAVREVMHLFERIAQKQIGIAEIDWALWCGRLEQSMIQAAGSSSLNAFLKTEINPLGLLRRPDFRPPHALSGTENGARYELALSHIEAKWGVAGFRSFGAGV
jgi:hypothetical protein